MIYIYGIYVHFDNYTQLLLYKTTGIEVYEGIQLCNYARIPMNNIF